MFFIAFIVVVLSEISRLSFFPSFFFRPSFFVQVDETKD